MGRGRKPEERSIVAGIRFNRAIKIFGKSIRTLSEDLKWEELVKIFDEKTIRTWIKNGIPLSKLSSVSQFFGVPGHIFSDEKINEKKFDKIIHDSKFLMDNHDADIPKELVHLWGEQVPGFGLFGVSQSSFSKLEQIKMIDRSTSNELLNISKKP